MAQKSKLQKSGGRRKEERDYEHGRRGTKPPTTLAERGEGIKEELDGVMEEIDSVLEENAEEFVKNYVQRGGE